MAFWNETGVEPKRSFRWILTLPNIGNQWIAKTVTRPSWETSMTPHKFINHEFKYPGRVTWNPVDVTLVDPVDPVDTTASMVAILRSSGYNFPTSFGEGSQTITKKLATEALGMVKITQIGESENDKLDEWTLYNSFVTTCNLGDLSYESDDLLTISMTIAYDFAYMTRSGRNSGGWTAANNLQIPPPKASNSLDDKTS